MINYENIYKLTKNMKLLFVEDDKTSRIEAADIFGYFFYSVDIAVDGVDGFNNYMDYFKKNDKYYDIVITDINMPNMNGIELSKLIFDKNPTQHLVIISAHDESKYLIELINIGVKNFLLKPIDYKKIMEVFFHVGCINKNLKKISQDNNDTNISQIDLGFNHFWIKESSQLLNNGTPIPLTKMEIDLMKLLIKNGPMISTNEEILDKIWGEDRDIVAKKNLAPLLSRLRRKLPKDIITTQYGLGYRLSIY